MRPCRTGLYFYSRPCGRGDFTLILNVEKSVFISTHAPAGGATSQRRSRGIRRAGFLLTPLREGRLFRVYRCPYCGNFYSRPCGRGDNIITLSMQTGQSFLLTPLREGRRGKGALIASFSQFLLTPLREGRLLPGGRIPGVDHISTHAPAGGATFEQLDNRDTFQLISTHAPAGGATPYSMRLHVIEAHFYSRPCGRGDHRRNELRLPQHPFLLTPLREGRPGLTASFRAEAVFLLTPLREGRQQFSTSPS